MNDNAIRDALRLLERPAAPPPGVADALFARLIQEVEGQSRRPTRPRRGLRMNRPRRALALVAAIASVALVLTTLNVLVRAPSAFAILERARERFDNRPFHATLSNTFGKFIGDDTVVVDLWFKSDTQWRSTITSSSNPNTPEEAGDFTVFDGKLFGRYESASNTFFTQPASEIDDPYGYSGVANHDPSAGMWPSPTGIKPTAEFLNQNCSVSRHEVAGRAADKLACDTGREHLGGVGIWLDRETGLILKVATAEVVREFLSIEYEPAFPAGIFDVAAPEGATVVGPGPETPAGASAEVDVTIPVGRGVSSIAVGLGAVWVVTGAGVSEERWQLRRVDPRTDAVVATTPVGAGASVGIGEGFVWVTSGRAARDSVRRLDAATSEFVGSPIPLGNLRETGIAVGEGAVWVTGAADDGPGALLRIDPETDEVTQTRLRGTPSGIALGAGSVWVFTQEFDPVDPNSPPKNLIFRVDARTTKVVATISAHGDLAYGEGALWALTPFAEGGRTSSLARIDPATNRLAAMIELPPGARALSTGAGYVWVANAEDGTLVRIDPATNRVTGDPIQLERGLQAVAIGEGAVWVGNYEDGTVARINVE